MSNQGLSPFFSPQGIAIIGVSREPAKLGYGLARNLIQSGYSGAIHLVNPRGGEIFGLPVYKTILDVPDPVDLVVILTAAPTVPDLLDTSGQRGIKAAILASGGFRESGPEGAALEVKCLEIAHRHAMRFIGPNCIGLIDTHLPLDTTFLSPPGPPKGDIAFISHSGAICAAVIDWVRGQGFGLSSLISLGNHSDVTESDVLGAVVDNPATDVVTLYLEGISDGKHFLEEARKASARKPLVALKVGRSASGQRAAASHTGALTGSETAFDAALNKTGVIRANSTEEMFQWARALAWCPLPKGDRVAILTNSGGPGVTAADAVELEGLQLAELASQTIEAFKVYLPSAASLHNPVDMLASASPENYAQSLQLLLQDPGVDSVLVITPPPPMFSAGAVARAIIPVIQASYKPVLVTLMGDRLIQEAVEHLRAVHIPDYRFPEPAISALAVLSRRRAILASLASEPLEASKTNEETARSIDSLPDGVAPIGEVSRWLKAYGIPTVPSGSAITPQEAIRLADQAGYPVVIKVASPDILHKSDVGGVLLNLQDAQAVALGFEQVIHRAKAAQPGARIEGVTVQPMLPHGQEVILGIVRDDQFGPLVMFGSGGVEVEGLKDLAFALAPLSRQEAESMVERTWAGRKLKGFRSIHPAYREGVVDALVQLARLAYDHPRIAEIEINPLLATRDQVFALDIRARLG